MLPRTIAFTFTDAVGLAATRESWLALGRRLFSPLALGLLLVTSVLFVRSLDRGDSLLWVILLGTSPVLLGLVFLFWLSGLVWTPIVTRRRLARLLAREVSIVFTNEGFSIVTSNETTTMGWRELKELRPLPHFWILALRTGAEIAIPIDLIDADLLAIIRGLAPSARGASAA